MSLFIGSTWLQTVTVLRLIDKNRNLVINMSPAIPGNRDDVWPKVDRGSWGNSGTWFLICRSWCSGRRRLRVEVRLAPGSSPCLFSSVASLSHSEDNLFQSRPLPDEFCGQNWQSAAWYSQSLMLEWPFFSVSLNRFLYPPQGLWSWLSWEKYVLLSLSPVCHIQYVCHF